MGNTPPKNSRIHILLKCTWDSHQSRLCIRPQNKSQYIFKCRHVSKYLFNYNMKRLESITEIKLENLQICGNLKILFNLKKVLKKKSQEELGHT